MRVYLGSIFGPAIKGNYHTLLQGDFGYGFIGQNWWTWLNSDHVLWEIAQGSACLSKVSSWIVDEGTPKLTSGVV